MRASEDPQTVVMVAAESPTSDKLLREQNGLLQTQVVALQSQTAQLTTQGLQLGWVIEILRTIGLDQNKQPDQIASSIRDNGLLIKRAVQESANY